ncbi:MAG: SAM-dependent methyltransferase [Kofleriaceae bacterium]
MSAAAGGTPAALSARELMARFPSGLALEDFTSFHRSLEIRLSRAYWRKRGGQAFLEREVPNDITNDGTRAARAAEVLFANCIEVDASGGGGPIRVLELGVGMGLFARLVLRRFRELCGAHGKDFYSRLTYHATDYSEQNLLDIQRLGTLDDFEDHVRLSVVDATAPAQFTPLGRTSAKPWVGGFRAVFHNYLYDALPTSMVLRQEGRWYELRIQARLSEPWRVEELSGLSFDALLDLLRRGDDASVDALVPLYSFINAERSFFPVELDQLPYGDEVRRFADEVLQPWIDEAVGPQRNLRMWVPWGGMTSFSNTAPLLEPHGFMLMTDYGSTRVADVTGARAYQRYGAGVCVNVNFVLLEQFVRQRGFEICAAEGDDDLPLHGRLFTRASLAQTRARFQETFAAGDFETLESHLTEARALVQKDHVKALEHYYAAVQVCPHNWRTLAELAHVENAHAERHDRALELIDQALALNPTCSSDLWSERGDILVILGQLEEAERAYQRGVTLNPSHSRSHYNLAWLWAEMGRFVEALEACGRALATDRTGEASETILAKQRDILARRREAYDAERERVLLRHA